MIKLSNQKLAVIFKVILVLLAIVLISCSPKVVSHSLNSSHTDRSPLFFEPFAIIERDTIDRSKVQLLGRIEVKDSGFTLNCDYQTVKNLAKQQTLKLGGNSYVITEHKKPNAWSTCHRIKADVFFIDNAEDYEKEIVWNKNRPLKISDFKGSILKRPFTAATSSTFRYAIEGRYAFPNKYKVHVESYFDCYLSYFKHTDGDSAVLAHEQVHFDIAELHARKFKKAIDQINPNLNEMLGIQDSLYDAVFREMILKQEEYDSEVYGNRDLQTKWNQWIKDQLINTNQYTDKTWFINNSKN